MPVACLAVLSERHGFGFQSVERVANVLSELLFHLFPHFQDFLVAFGIRFLA